MIDYITIANVYRPHVPLGYALEDERAAQAFAMARGNMLIDRLRVLSRDVQSWADAATKEARQILNEIQHLRPGAVGSAAEARMREKLQAAMDCETGISTRIHQYFTSSSDLISELEYLNPPLHAEDVQKFIDDAKRERSRTLIALEEIKQVILDLSETKLRLALDGNA